MLKKKIIFVATVAVAALTGLVAFFTGSGAGRGVVKETLKSEPTDRTLAHFPKTKIIGGNAVSNDRYKWFALGSNCGASLISPEWLLTAAHCDERGFQDVRIGAVCRGSVDPEYTNCGNYYEMQKAISQHVHPDYDENTSLYDFRLVHLKKSSSVTPVKIDDGTLSFNYTEGQSDLWTAGFGLTAYDPKVQSNYLMHLEKKYVPFSMCKKYYKKKDGYELDRSILCAQNEDDQKSACYGDSGGPLYDAANQKLVGVVSGGPEDCQGKPVKYGRIAAGFEWIKQTICEESRNKPDLCFDDASSAPSKYPSKYSSPEPSTKPIIQPSAFPSISIFPTISPSIKPTSTEDYFQIMYTDSKNETKWCIESPDNGEDRRLKAEICDFNNRRQFWFVTDGSELRNMEYSQSCITDSKRGIMEMKTCTGSQVFVYDSFKKSWLSIRNKANIRKWGLKAITIDVPQSLEKNTSLSNGVRIRTLGKNNYQQQQLINERYPVDPR